MSGIKPRTLNITPFLLKISFYAVSVYIIYAVAFFFNYGIFPYAFGYTVYISSEDYDEYGIDEGDLLLIKYVECSYDTDLVINNREDKLGYEVLKGEVEPYGLVISTDIVEDLKEASEKLFNK